MQVIDIEVFQKDAMSSGVLLICESNKTGKENEYPETVNI